GTKRQRRKEWVHRRGAEDAEIMAMDCASSAVNPYAILTSMLVSTNRDSRLWRTGLFALALFTLIRSGIWVVVNPPFNAGDETAHLMYIMQLRDTGALPVYKFTPPPDCTPSPDSTPADPFASKLI